MEINVGLGIVRNISDFMCRSAMLRIHEANANIVADYTKQRAANILINNATVQKSTDLCKSTVQNRTHRVHMFTFHAYSIVLSVF